MTGYQKCHMALSLTFISEDEPVIKLAGPAIESQAGMVYTAITEYKNNFYLSEVSWHQPENFYDSLAKSKGYEPFYLAVEKEFIEFFAGMRKVFDIPVLMTETDPSIKPSFSFTSRVYLQLATIPYAQLISYAALGDKAGQSNAARAVGNAMRTNPLPVIVPCHRVIRSDGKPGHYTGGDEIKEWLHVLEQGNQ